MLGYVRIDKGELKVREYEIYCGYYCGICKSIASRYGQLPRMVLSYDAAFLALLLDSMNDTQDIPKQEHCIAHPFIKKKTVIRNKSIDFAADMMLILAWYKLLDDANDERKLYAKSTILLYKRIFNKLRKKYGRLCITLESELAKLHELEKSHCDSIDMTSEAFSNIMRAIFISGFKRIYGKDSEGSHLEAFSDLGFHLGKWIYLIDAVDDIDENISSKTYNPLLYRFNYDSSESPADFRKRIEDDLKFNLYHYLAFIGNGFNELDIRKNEGIIENIIYFGLNRKTEDIIEQKGDRDESI